MSSPKSKIFATSQDFDWYAMRFIRRMLEISQAQIALAISRSQFYVAAIERGEIVPTDEEAAIIWLKLGVVNDPAKLGRRK